MAESSLDEACRRLRDNDPALQQLDHEDQIGDEGVETLATALVGNTTLQMLRLGDNLIR